MAARTPKYPIQLVLMVSTEVGELITDIAQREELHKTEVTRSFLHAGIRKAGYADVLTIDKRDRPLTTLAPTNTGDSTESDENRVEG